MSIDEVLFNDIASTLGDRAFPVTISREGKTCTGTGLTKRELFAAMAMASIIQLDHRSEGGEFGFTPAKDAARFAVNYADALVATLSK